MQRTITAANGAPTAGPYSPALAWNDLVFISGQGPIDPRTGTVPSEDFDDQAQQALANLDVLLEASGSDRDRVLKVQLYVVDLAHFEQLNELYAAFFEGCTQPARTTIQAAALPGGIQVELDAIAYRRPE
jgi:2-iminobutanoate/2-iminopropanoate deaminase